MLLNQYIAACHKALCQVKWNIEKSSMHPIQLLINRTYDILIIVLRLGQDVVLLKGENVWVFFIKICGFNPKWKRSTILELDKIKRSVGPTVIPQCKSTFWFDQYIDQFFIRCLLSEFAFYLMDFKSILFLCWHNQM